MNALALLEPVQPGHLSLPLALSDVARDFALDAKAPSTRRAYRDAFADFTGWCRAHGLQAMPASPESVATYLASLAVAGLSVSTIGQRAAAIRYAHKLAGFDPPTSHEEVRATLSGIRRRLGAAPTHRKEPVIAKRLSAMLATCPDTLIGRRDRALLALGFAGAFRRSELVALEVSDLAKVDDGLRVTIRRSKTDQEGQGQEVAIPRGYRLRPVEAVQAWLTAAEISAGPVFRRVYLGGKIGDLPLTPHAVAVLVKDHARKAGLDPAEFSGHSLRSGFLTSAAESGASIFKMVEVSRHKSVDTLRGYVRRVDLFKEHAGAAFL